MTTAGQSDFVHIWFRVLVRVLLGLCICILPALAWHQAAIEREKLAEARKAFNVEIEAAKAQIEQLNADTQRLNADTEQLERKPLNLPNTGIGSNLWDEPCPPAVKLHKNTSGCDGQGGCHWDFLQPRDWGRCIQAEDKTLTCQQGDLISHYPRHSSTPDAAWRANSCPALAAQIKKNGQAPEIRVPMEIQVAPPTSGPKI